MDILGIKGIEESSTYQMILAKGGARGRAEEARQLLRRLGEKRFGTPEARIDAALDGISDREQIEALAERLLDVSSWDELVAPAQAG